ncbi:hypothetical protein CQW23_14484 [Capsicum baccatum]|uniref:Uncharacterized protein n=1 Tax=Capsicum baccatum TaxID=33114 RepID=A0A2G2WJ99_CAPBA|nr:hypothetical protein CQW23_14484 [Capsicum baccatum]
MFLHVEVVVLHHISPDTPLNKQEETQAAYLLKEKTLILRRLRNLSTFFISFQLHEGIAKDEQLLHSKHSYPKHQAMKIKDKEEEKTCINGSKTRRLQKESSGTRDENISSPLGTEEADIGCSGPDMNNLVKDASMGPLIDALRHDIEITKLKKEDMRPGTL